MSKPNVLLIFADQWRRHSVGFMQEDPVITPNLDRMAAEGMAFTNAISCIPICTPYRATMLTGRYPISTTVIGNNIMLPPEEITIANCLKDAGYATGYIGKWHLDGEPWDHYVPKGERRQGFDYWYANGCYHQHFQLNYWGDDPEPITGMGWQPDHETDVALDYLKNRNLDKPFFLCVSYAPPHTIHGGPNFEPGGKNFQYAAPAKFEALYRDNDLPRRPNVPGDYYADGQAGYFGAITSIDENIGRLMTCLDEQGIADDTIVVFTTDHGELMGSHGQMTKNFWYEESLGIPFIIRWPKCIESGARNDAVFNSVDVMPSILGLLGLPIPECVEGTDFSDGMLGRKDVRPSSAYCTYYTGWRFEDDDARPWRLVRTERHTYVVGQTNGGPLWERLYDNEADPYQMTEIGKEDMPPDLRTSLREELIGWLNRTKDPWAACVPDMSEAINPDCAKISAVRSQPELRGEA